MERKGSTLIELLVVAAIVGVLLALTLPAIVRLRDAALTTAGANQLRQVALATLHYADAQNGILTAQPNGPPILSNILPFTDAWPAFAAAGTGTFDWEPAVRRLFVSPSDPSLEYYPTDPAIMPLNGNTSYAANALAFVERPMRYPESLSDGTSNTVLFAEHVARCGTDARTVGVTQFVASLGTVRGKSHLSRFHRGSFSDAAYRDVTPTSPASATSAIQPTPPFQKCDPKIPQALHSSGMLAAMGDGGVRTIAPSIDPRTFWSLVTPDGGEVPRGW
jgi:prepilin-type N-terminal cleavage/methylation domain-containing protein